MKVVIIYRSDSEHGRIVEDYLRDFLRRTGTEIETLDPDSKAGISLCRTYDIVEYPTVIALSDDGRMQNNWRGLPLPTISELSYYS
ncbi:hypothetical protein H7142_03345 [Candidatus Saccharibacteria bacterium]|nr:hypothetical protein [Candidatus Saccharibacteria bacterium]